MFEELIKNKTLIRYLVYKKMFTPYEQEERFIDESQFEDTRYSFGIIEDMCVIGGEIYLKIRCCSCEPCDEEYEIDPWCNYFKFSDIKISEFDNDKKLILVNE